MSPSDFSIVNGHPYTVSVASEGGEITIPFWNPKVSDRQFMRALHESITKSGVFSAIIQGEDADYRLVVEILNLYQAEGITTAIVTNWRLTKVSTNDLIFDDVIISSHTTSFWDGVLYFIRLRRATEGAARENIRRGINRLSKLKLE
jgi:hypothetical protein